MAGEPLKNILTSEEKTMPKLNMTPKSWNQLIRLKEFLTDCDGKFLRLSDDRLFYKLYQELVPRNIALEIVKKQMADKPVSLLPNNFPYTKTLKYLPNVKHFCLWSTKGRLKEKDIKKHASKKFGGKEWFYMERKRNAKSVPEIWHCHIFVKEQLPST